MKKLSLFLILLLACSLTRAQAQGNAYHVSPSGNDSNPGTASRPWKTLNKAAQVATAGDTVFIHSGTFNERLYPVNSGTADAEITFAAYPGDAPVLDGSEIYLSDDSGLIDLSNLSYIRVDGLRVINSLYGAVWGNDVSHITLSHIYTYNSASSGIAIFGGDHVTVEYSEVVNSNWNGMQEAISIADVDTFVVRYNRVHMEIDPLEPGKYPKEGITIKDGSRNGRVHGNEVYSTYVVGFYIDASDAETYNIEFYQNVVHNTYYSDGISLASEIGGRLHDIHVYNNVSYQNHHNGLWISGCCPGVTSHPIQNVTIVNNTFYDNGLDNIPGEDPWGGGIGVENPEITGLVIRNNLISQNYYYQLAYDGSQPLSAIAADHNLIDGYHGTENEQYGTDFVVGDPLFVNAASADFRLLYGSPAIDSGEYQGAPLFDFTSLIRPQGSGFDIGAYEYYQPFAWAYLPALFR